MSVKGNKDQFSAAKMFNRLNSPGSATLSVVGLVRQNDDDARAIDLALPPYANKWTTIPETSIAGFDHVGSLELDGVERHLVRLRLKRPDDHPAALFHDLLAAHMFNGPVLARHEALESGAPPTSILDRFCYYDSAGVWHCS